MRGVCSHLNAYAAMMYPNTITRSILGPCPKPACRRAGPILPARCMKGFGSSLSYIQLRCLSGSCEPSSSASGSFGAASCPSSGNNTPFEASIDLLWARSSVKVMLGKKNSAMETKIAIPFASSAWAAMPGCGRPGAARLAGVLLLLAALPSAAFEIEASKRVPGCPLRPSMHAC